jgi:hypothetical protein
MGVRLVPKGMSGGKLGPLLESGFELCGGGEIAPENVPLKNLSPGVKIIAPLNLRAASTPFLHNANPVFRTSPPHYFSSTPTPF